jgi:hypothetical protein
MANKHMKKSSTSVTIKAMQIKMTLNFHLTPMKMTIINNTNNKNAGVDVGEKENFYTAGRNINKSNLYGKQYGGLSED